MFQVPVIDVNNDQAIFDGEGFDAVVVVTPDLNDVAQQEISLLAEHAKHIDHRVGKQATLLFAPGLAGGRLIISPVTGDDDYADVRISA